MSWLLLRCKSGNELAFCAALTARGFDAFTPVREYYARSGYRRRLPGGKRSGRLSVEPEKRVEALFAGYLFARGEAADVIAARLVVHHDRLRPVLRDGCAVVLSGDIVDRLKMQQGSGCFDETTAFEAMYGSLIGMAITVPHGPFTGMRATIQRVLSLDAVEASGDLGGKPFTISLQIAEHWLTGLDNGRKL